MKIQKRIFFSVLIFIVVINIIIYYLFTHTVYSIKKDIKYINVKKDEITYKLPITTEYQKTSKEEKYNWKTDYFDIKIGRLQISSKDYNKNWDFYNLINNFFKIKINEKIKSKFYFSKSLFYLRLKMFEDGALVVKKLSKQSTRYIYIFSFKNKLYWFSFFSNQSYEIFKDIFDDIILSIRAIDNTKRTMDLKDFESELNSVCLKTYFLLCQNFNTLIIIISIFVGFIFVAIFLVMSNYIGKLPDEEKISRLLPLYKEERVEILVNLSFKKNFSTCSFIITSDKLIIFKAKKEFISIELKNKNEYELKKGINFFKDKYVEISFTNMDFVKSKLYKKFAIKIKKMRIRLYTNNHLKVYNLLSSIN